MSSCPRAEPTTRPLWARPASVVSIVLCCSRSEPAIVEFWARLVDSRTYRTRVASTLMFYLCAADNPDINTTVKYSIFNIQYLIFNIQYSIYYSCTLCRIPGRAPASCSPNGNYLAPAGAQITKSRLGVLCCTRTRRRCSVVTDPREIRLRTDLL